MKTILKTTLSFFLVTAILVGLVWLVFLVGNWLFACFGSLQKEVAAGIIAALTAVTISVVSLMLSKSYERKADIVKQHREKKVPIYEESINFWFQVFMAEKAGEKPPTEQETIKFLTDFTRHLIVWGSDSVLKSFTIFREFLISDEGKKTPTEGMLLFEQYLFEIRKDLGHKNKDLGRGDILALFINDIRAYTGSKNNLQSGGDDT